MVRPLGQLISALDANVVVVPSGVVFEMRPGDWQFVLYTFPSASTATPTGAAIPCVAYVVTVPSGVIFEIRLPPMFDLGEVALGVERVARRADEPRGEDGHVPLRRDAVDRRCRRSG